MMKILINKKSDTPSMGIRGIFSLIIGALILVNFSYEFTQISHLIVPVLGVGLLGLGITLLAESFDKLKNA